MKVAPLVHHPTTPSPAVQRLTARVALRGRDGLVLSYTLSGDIGSIHWPPPKEPKRADELWRTTCFEAFIAGSRSPGYAELNFSPSGEWAAYRFDAYRQGMAPVASLHAPQITCTRLADSFTMDVDVMLAALDEIIAGELKLGLSCVVQTRDGQSSYWALAHAPGKPDFHDPAAFTLTLHSGES